MKIMNFYCKRFLLLCILMLSYSGFAQVAGAHFTVSLANPTSTANTMEFDVMLTVDPTGVALADGGSRIAAMSVGINFNGSIMNGGTPSTANNGGSFVLVSGTKDAQLSGLLFAQEGTYRGIQTGNIGQLRLVGTALSGAASINTPPGTYRIGRYKFTNTVEWAANTNANLYLQPNVGPPAGSTNTIVTAYKWNATTLPYSYTTIAPSGTPGVSLSHSSASTLSLPLNSNVCATSGAASNLVNVTPCIGASNGSATITLSPTPTTTSVSYTVDGGAAQNATLVSGAFTVSGLAAGDHTVVVTPSGCSAVTVPSFNISGTPLTTTGSMSASACDSYTWAENGQTYTSSGTYTSTVGCNTATLTLTITPSTSNTTTESACDSYTWSVNGQTYTSSGSYSNTVGCHTEVLNLTITPSTSNTSSASACDSYTWSVNGQTYTSSGSYSSVSGCHTEILNLTITPSTSNTTSQTACDSYTWSVNGTTYASSGTYSNTVGCHTEVLNLTITPSTSNTTSETACGTYTWSVNGQTYTSSGTYTSVSGCHTEILNLTINTSAQTYYADTDGDGFGAGAAILSCAGQPEGTSTNNTDCAPADATKWRTGMFYTDADGDGYNNGFPQTSVCYGAATPAGYTLVNLGTDCNDELASVNPNASEIPGNNIDDNCDGNMDEVYPTSFLNSASCGVTLTNLANALYAYNLATYVGTSGNAVQGYRFEVTNGSNVRTYESTANSFTLMNLAGGAVYATTYSVRVSVKIQGFWRAYGSVCTVTTPAVPNSTNVTQPACGSTLVNIANTIYCGQVASATGYRFRVRNGSTVVGTYDATVNRFSLTDLGVQNISFATTYTIDVLLRFGATWRPDSEYGSVCTITTPATPGASRVINPACGSTITRLWTTIYAQQVVGAQGYKFVVTSTSPATSRQITTTGSAFSLMSLPGGAQPGVTYTIRVDVLYNSSYVQGTQTCDITVSPVATRQTASAINVYDVKAYPNPFADNFKLELNSSSENEVNVKVYDMLGREVESRVSSVAALSNLEIGSRFPSGVYNIIVTQGDNVKTVRVIKR